MIIKLFLVIYKILICLKLKYCGEGRDAHNPIVLN